MIDLNNLRIPTSYEQDFRIETAVTTIPVRKPKKTDFFRIRDDPDWEMDLFLLDMQEGDEEKYLVLPQFAPELNAMGLLKRVRIYTGITYSTNVLFLSDVGLPDAEGKHNEYNRSRMEAYEVAKSKWARIYAIQDPATYGRDTTEAFGEPDWPERPETFSEAINIAFKDRVIDSEDHPILKRLRGEA